MYIEMVSAATVMKAPYPEVSRVYHIDPLCLLFSYMLGSLATIICNLARLKQKFYDVMPLAKHS